ncbi:MAG: energy transducer TonB [Candidatus Eisenbacteria bacterium]
MRSSIAFSLVLLLLAGCGRDGGRPASRAVHAELPISILADSAERLSMPAARQGRDAASQPRLTLQRVSPSRAALEIPLPDAAPALPPAADPDQMQGEGLVVDDDLRPPIARSAAAFTLKGARPGWVELDVRVDEQGEVSDAVVVEAAADSATQAGAIEAAYAVRFHPASLRGRAVAVWCRQRFEVRRR